MCGAGSLPLSSSLSLRPHPADIEHQLALSHSGWPTIPTLTCCVCGTDLSTLEQEIAQIDRDRAQRVVGPSSQDVTAHAAQLCLSQTALAIKYSQNRKSSTIVQRKYTCGDASFFPGRVRRNTVRAAALHGPREALYGCPTSQHQQIQSARTFASAASSKP